MNKLKIVAQNLLQGMHLVDEVEKKKLFSKYWPSAYTEYYAKHKPDIVCFTEAPLDDKEGNSVFLDDFSEQLKLPHYKVYVNDASWLVEGKYYGMAILSRYEIENYESFNLPNPRLEVDHADGTHWIMHDKGAQKVTVEIGGKRINIFNLHYFPLFHFGRRIDEPEFHQIRADLAEILRPKKGEISIVAGDFNNKDVDLEKAFPEIFEGELLNTSVLFDGKEYPLYEGGETQLDHILYSEGLKFLGGTVESNFSDHVGLTTEFEIT